MKAALEIFRVGKHTALGGQIIEFGEADLAATAAAYDPNLHEAPLVVGHPGIDAPAYGWVAALGCAGGLLTAEPNQVDPAFAEMVNAGRFKKISGSFYLPEAPANPVPGVYYLRHVGFLGAQPPAVTGLKSASFAAAEEGVIEFGDWADQVEAGLFRKLREWIIAKFGQADADQALPGWDVDAVQNEAAQPEEPDEGEIAQAFAENQQKQEGSMMPTPEEIAARETAMQQKEAAFAEREAKLKEKELLVIHQEHLAFAEGLITEGKLLPAQKDHAVALLDFAGEMAVDLVIEFGEGEAKKSLAVAEILKGFLSGQPKIVEFGEVTKTESTQPSSADFAAAPGYTVEAEALVLHQRALAYKGTHPGTDYMDAVRAVSA